jgi:hypothetical protein
VQAVLCSEDALNGRGRERLAEQHHFKHHGRVSGAQAFVTLQGAQQLVRRLGPPSGEDLWGQGDLPKLQTGSNGA